MRSLTERAAALATKEQHEIAWVLTVEWPDGGHHYAQRKVTLTDGNIPAGLLEPGKLDLTTGKQPDTRERLGAARLSVALSPDAEPGLRERVATWDPEGLEVCWGLLFLDGDPADIADRVVLFRGIIVQVEVHREKIVLFCEDMLTARGARAFGREVRADALPEPDSQIEGQMLPVVFGDAGSCELLPWRSGQATELAEDAQADDTTMLLASTENLPARGVLQVGDERLIYEVVDHATSQIGGAGFPLLRPTPATHRAGSRVRLVPDNGFEWLVAAHPCHQVTDVAADGVRLSATDWTLTTEVWEGSDIQKVTLSAWPVTTRYESGVSTLVADGASGIGAWQVADGTTALNAIHAFDADAESTFAELHATARVLRGDMSHDLSGGAMRHGTLAAARLRLRIGADRQWEYSTALRVRARKGTEETVHTIPRPAAFMLTAQAAIEVTQFYGPVDYTVDLTTFIQAQGGWNALENADPLQVEVEIETVGDPVHVFVWDVALDVDYHARTSTRPAKTLTAKVRGLAPEGVLLENPAEIAEWFLTAPEGFGLASYDLDTASFADVAQQLTPRHYRFSNRFSATRALRSVLSRLLFECRCRLVWSGEKVRLVLDSADHEILEPDIALSDDHILKDVPLERMRTTNSALLRDVRLHYGRDFSGEQSVSWRDAFFRQTIDPPQYYDREGGALADRLQWHNHGEVVVLEDLSHVLLSRHGFRRELVQVGVPLSCVAVETEDRASLEESRFPVTLEQGRVTGVHVRHPGFLTLDLIFEASGAACETFSSETFIRHRSSGRLKEFWIARVLVATLSWDGNLTLRGTLREAVELTHSVSDTFTFDSATQVLSFATGTASFAPFATLDSSGNLNLAGLVREQTPRDEIMLVDCWETDEAHMAIGTGLSAPALVFDIAAQTLLLPGQLIESMDF